MKSFALIILFIGICFRFTHLDNKVYWIDEVHTSLRISGYTRQEFVTQAPTNQIISQQQLHQFQTLTPTRDFRQAVRAIASSEHSPLYYILARLGIQSLGSSINITRGVATLLSLLAFPCIFWLTYELFSSPLISWLSVAIFAISPFHLLYAQEAREYSLLTAAILFASASFLRAIKKSRVINWLWYLLGIVVGLYTQPLAGFALLSHGIYLLIINQFKWRKILTIYTIVSVLGLVLFIPWIIVFINNGDGVGNWINRNISVTTWLQRWLVNLSSLFFDLQVGYQDNIFNIETGKDLNVFSKAIYPFIGLMLVSLIIYALYYLWLNAPGKSSLFIFSLIGTTAVIQIIPDLLGGGQRATIGRYLIPIYLGIEIAVVYLLTSKLYDLNSRTKFKSLWLIITVVIFSLGSLSCRQILQANTWWNKYSSYYNYELAQIINKNSNNLVVAENKRISRLTSLSYLLKQDTKFLLLNQQVPLWQITENTKNVYIFRPYPETLQLLRDKYKSNLISLDKSNHLWLIKK